MGLNKRKPILIQDFNINPFDAENRKLSSISKSSMPTIQDDVVLEDDNAYFNGFIKPFVKLFDFSKYCLIYLSLSNNLFKTY